MRNFRINPPQYQEPEPVAHWYDVGTRIVFCQNQFDDEPEQVINLTFAIA